MADETELQPPPLFDHPGSKKSVVWKYFAFYKKADGPATKDNLDMTKAVCRLCRKEYANKGEMNFNPDDIPDPDLVFGSEDEKTIQYADKLSPLPVPDLHHTLERYLDSVRPHLTDEEFRQTEFIVQQFGSGIGKDLHKKLQERAKGMKNWLKTWWEDFAYLEGRYPTAPFVNFAGPGPYMHTYYPPQEGTQLERGAMILYFSLRFWKLIKTEKLKPDRDSKGNYLCMDQFHRAFNTCKIPGVKKDKLLFHFKTESEGFSPIHLTVFCNGRIFAFDAIDENGEPLTQPELKLQLQRIRNMCEGQPPGPGLGALTGDNRTSWAQMRSRLISLHPDNYHNLELIQSSLFSLQLSDYSPADESDVFQRSLAGDPCNRWFDKSAVFIIYKNGLIASNCDHAPMDAMVVVVSTFYNDVGLMRCKGKWQGTNEIRDLPQPRELVFHLDDVLEAAIIKARDMFLMAGSNLSCCTKHFTRYGKKFLRSKKLHPDTHVQLALQYGYYKMHNRPAPTYETATTRKFYHARTETMRSCTTEAIDWCRAMLDSSVSNERKRYLYLKAAEKHNRLMAEAQNLQGCDRHLLGLYLIAREEGLPTPLLYEDKGFTKSGGGGNFVLSTSFTGYTTVYGAVAPMLEDGYGVFYRIEPDKIVPVMTSWLVSKETNAEKFCDQVLQCLDVMGDLLDKENVSSAKL